MTSQMITDYLIDCLGYSNDDFYGYSISELYDMLTPEQQSECINYSIGGEL